MNRLIEYVSQILFLVRKEMLSLFKDRMNRRLLFLPAFLQALLFGYGANFDLTNVPYAVFDQSRGAAASVLLARLDGTGVFHRVATLTSSSQIAETIDSSKALLIIHIPPDFEERLNAGREAPLQVILDARNSTTASSAASHIAAIVAGYNRQLGSVPAITVERRAWYNPNLESRWNFMPGLIASLSMMQTLMVAALSVAREREQGTFDQLLVAPLTPMQILVGKAFPSILIGLLQSTIIFAIIRFWFQVPMNGSLFLLYAGLLGFTVASVGIGLSVSAFSSTMQQAMLYTFMLVMPLMLLSGLVTPIRNMPEILQWATYANPLRFGIDTTRRVYLEGAVFSDVALNFIPLVIITGISIPVSAWLFRNRLA